MSAIPISLLTTDLEVFAKALALCLERVIHALVNADQTGFIRGRLISDNIRRLLHIIDVTDGYQNQCAVFSLDAEKAWEYMWTALKHFGFKQKFVPMIKTLYHTYFESVLAGVSLISPVYISAWKKAGLPTFLSLGLPLSRAFSTNH